MKTVAPIRYRVRLPVTDLSVKELRELSKLARKGERPPKNLRGIVREFRKAIRVVRAIVDSHEKNGGKVVVDKTAKPDSNGFRWFTVEVVGVGKVELRQRTRKNWREVYGTKEARKEIRRQLKSFAHFQAR